MTAAPGLDALEARAGFYGKLPARGDFLRQGLPRGFTDPWDAWWQQMIAQSRAAMGDLWLAAWLEAPVWRFALAPGVCGADAAVGLWMPSVDSVGRYFPLTIAAVAAGPLRGLAQASGGFLAAAEQAGLDALELDTAPDALAGQVGAALRAPDPPTSGLPEVAAATPNAGASWWTDGGPRVASCRFSGAGLPDAATFATMLAGTGA